MESERDQGHADKLGLSGLTALDMLRKRIEAVRDGEVKPEADEITSLCRMALQALDGTPRSAGTRTSDVEQMREALHLLASTLFGPFKEDHTHYLRRLASCGGDDLKVYTVKPTNDGGILTVKDARKIWDALQIPKATHSASERIEETEDSKGDWQCRDYADGWITFPTRKAAEKYQNATGALMRYVRQYHRENATDATSDRRVTP